jgi:hypothetical protein
MDIEGGAAAGRAYATTPGKPGAGSGAGAARLPAKPPTTRRSVSATCIVSPLTGKEMGSARYDLDLLEGGYSKAFTDPTLLRWVRRSS